MYVFLVVIIVVTTRAAARHSLLQECDRHGAIYVSVSARVK